jgi:hypothetical protein
MRPVNVSLEIGRILLLPEKNKNDHHFEISAYAPIN